MESKRRALVIGISDYENLGSLTFCRNDGHGMVDVLSSLNYEMLENNVMLGNVRWENMRDAIYDFFSNENVKPTDTLLFYYSGHGVPDDDQDRIMKLWVVASGRAYQVTYDAPKEQYAQNLPAVQEIIKSIKLDNPAGCKVGKI
jgi:uncharacterized caspase-like protein